MTQQANPLERAAGFLHYQGAKDFDELAALMRRTSEDWAQCLEGLSEAQAMHQPNPGESEPQTPVSGEGPKWCMKEVVGHYLLSERSLNNTAAGLTGVAPPPSPGPTVRGMGQQSPEYEALPLEGLKSKLSQFFEETVTLIEGLRGSSKLDETYPHPVFGPLNVKEWLAFHRLHAIDHIQQIERIKADARYPKT